jgi:hypothetical protein
MSAVAVAQAAHMPGVAVSQAAVAPVAVATRAVAVVEPAGVAVDRRTTNPQLPFLL